jgi:type IV pilus assembly protein PilA
MLARMHRSMEKRDEGFTLIELLVVMIIIGILAAIAIPVFLNQRKKGRDTSTKADVSTIGKEIATYYVDGAGTLELVDAATTPDSVTLRDGTAAGSYNSAALKLSNGTVPTSSTTTPAGVGFVAGKDTWCVSLTNPDGADKAYMYSAVGGLVKGTC